VWEVNLELVAPNRVVQAEDLECGKGEAVPVPLYFVPPPPHRSVVAILAPTSSLKVEEQVIKVLAGRSKVVEVTERAVDVRPFSDDTSGVANDVIACDRKFAR
jgi:hypothetical protein